MTYGLYYGNEGMDGNKTITRYPETTFFTTRYFIYNRLAIGCALGLGAEHGTYSNGPTPGYAHGSYNVNNTTLAFEVYYIYFFRKYLEVYTYAGIGPSFISKQEMGSPGFDALSYKTEIVKAQYTPAGIRFGGRIGGYAELGYGYKGMVNLGISFKIGPSCWWKDDFR